MASANSALTTFETDLLTFLSGRSGLSGVSILGREPTSRKDLTATSGAEEAIWIADVDATLITPHAGNAGHVTYDENAVVPVIVQVLNPRTDQTLQEVKDRAAVLFNVVVAAIAADPAVGNASPDHLIYQATLTGYTRAAGKLPGGKGFGARYALTVELHARITGTTLDA